MRKYLYELSLKQFQKIQNNEDLHFFDYDVIADETEHLFTYQMENKVGSFSDVVYNQLNQSPQKITDLNDILQDETLWAYCVEFEMDSDKSFYTFRKLSPGKVGVEKEKDGENDKASGLDRKDIFRVNLGLRKEAFIKLFGEIPARPAAGAVVDMNYDFKKTDEILPHPVYAWMG